MSARDKYEELRRDGSFYRFWGSDIESAEAEEAIQRWLSEPSETERYIVAYTSQHYDATLYVDRGSPVCHPIYEILVATRPARQRDTIKQDHCSVCGLPERR